MKELIPVQKPAGYGSSALSCGAGWAYKRMHQKRRVGGGRKILGSGSKRATLRVPLGFQPMYESDGIEVEYFRPATGASHFIDCLEKSTICRSEMFPIKVGNFFCLSA
jgi:hypothetical protein